MFSCDVLFNKAVWHLPCLLARLQKETFLLTEGFELRSDSEWNR
jgi:hypothetical protein